MERENPLISVIVPIYQIEEYLSDLIQDVLKQTFSDFELLLVNNASKDGCQNIIEEYEKKDRRICGLYQKIQGVGAARNYGLDHAKGKYIVFFDGDDRVSQDTLEKYLEAMTEGVVLCNSGYTTEYQGKVVDKTKEEPKQWMDEMEYFIRLYKDDRVDYQGFLWDKMFLAERIQEKNIRFREDISYNEDRLFVTEYMSYGGKVKWINEHLYHYQVRDNSAMSASREYFATEREMDELDAFEEIIRLLEPYSKAQKYAKNNMAIAELRLFKRMLDKKQFARFRHSRLRKHARKFNQLGYMPKNYNESIICKKLRFYGFTGISYSGSDVRELKDISF